MKRLLLSLAVAGTAIGGGTARAQVAANQEISSTAFDPDQSVAPVSYVEGPGVKVGEGTVLHPVLGLESGYVSNVFYDRDPKGAAMIRLIAQIGAGSLTGVRLNPATPGESPPHEGEFEYRADVRLAYDQYISGDSTVNAVSGLGVGAVLRGVVHPEGKLTFAVDENFQRLIRAANFETDANTNRDLNIVGLTLLWHPPSSALSGSVYYTNSIDIFEHQSEDFADRMDNRVGIRPMWRILPQTTLFADISEGVVTGIGSSSVLTENGTVANKVTSFPLLATLGVASLLTPNITVNLSGGYTNGFYESGPSFSGATASAAAAYRFSPLGRFGVSYQLNYTDSVNANFYRDHVIEAWVQQGFDPFVVLVQPEIHFRHYDGITVVDGPPTRDDVIYAVVAGVHYNFRNSLAITVDYRLSAVETNYRYLAGGVSVDPGWIRHEALAGIRWAL